MNRQTTSYELTLNLSPSLEKSKNIDENSLLAHSARLKKGAWSNNNERTVTLTSKLVREQTSVQ